VLLLEGRLVSLKPVVGLPGDLYPQRNDVFSCSRSRSIVPFVPPEEARLLPRRRRSNKRKLLNRSSAMVMDRTAAYTPLPVRKSVIVPDVTPRKAGESTVLRKAQAAWAMKPASMENLSVPIWYSGLHGVPNWLLRQKASSKKMDEKRKALALLVRMNYILDYAHKFVDMDQLTFFGLPTRKLRVFTSVFGPIYQDGAYRSIGVGTRMNTSYASSSLYDWKRALVCTVRNFVHLLALQVRPKVPVSLLRY
jgi:hypothetical protein